MEAAAVKLVQIQKTMSTEDRLMLQSQYDNERKDPTIALVLAFFGIHYFYLGNIGLGVVFMLTFGGLGVWWLIDLFRVKKLADEYNLQKVDEISTLIRA